MKKFENLGRKLSREEQKAINGGFFIVYNATAICVDQTLVGGCGANCQDAYAQCDSACSLRGSSVSSYGQCTQDNECL
jgi:hypothetical protein